MSNKLFSMLSNNYTHWYVMPLDLLRVWQSVFSPSSITLKKSQGYLIATTNPRDDPKSESASNLPRISFRIFADKDEQVAKQEAIDWFEKNKLDIEQTDNWLIN